MDGSPTSRAKWVALYWVVKNEPTDAKDATRGLWSSCSDRRQEDNELQNPRRHRVCTVIFGNSATTLRELASSPR
jgi:hypothetical protein